MLKLTGLVGKSIIADAIKKYNNARIYSYDKELIPVLESYHINSDECTVKEFCGFVFKDIKSLSYEDIPINMVVIYTNLTDVEDVELVKDYGRRLENEKLVGTVVVMSKI